MAVSYTHLDVYKRQVNNNANEAYDMAKFETGIGGLWFDKSLGLSETKEVRLNSFAAVPVRKTYTSDPQQFGYLDRSQDKLNVPMHYVICLLYTSRCV